MSTNSQQFLSAIYPYHFYVCVTLVFINLVSLSKILHCMANQSHFWMRGPNLTCRWGHAASKVGSSSSGSNSAPIGLDGGGRVRNRFTVNYRRKWKRCERIINLSYSVKLQRWHVHALHQINELTKFQLQHHKILNTKITVKFHWSNYEKIEERLALKTKLKMKNYLRYMEWPDINLNNSAVPYIIPVYL